MFQLGLFNTSCVDFQILVWDALIMITNTALMGSWFSREGTFAETPLGPGCNCANCVTLTLQIRQIRQTTLLPIISR